MSTSTTAVQGNNKPIKTDWRALLSPLTVTLGALLALQLLIALALELGGTGMEPAGSQGPLLAFNPEKVTNIRVRASDENGDGKPVLVTKTGDGWIIPSLQDLPAAEHKVTGLLSKLHDLQKGLPVATSEEALKRFKVAEEDFERKLTLEEGDTTPAILYLGDSPGFRRLFVRAEGDGAVYEAEIGLFDAPDKADAWSDRSLLHLKMEDIQKLTIAGVPLEHKDDSWRLANLAKDEEQDEQAIKDAVRNVANIDFLGVLAADEVPETDKEITPVEIDVTLKSGKTIKYRITKLAAGNDYLLKVSNRPQRFTLASYAAEDFTGMSRANLLKESEEVAVTSSQEPPPAENSANESSSPAAVTAAPPAVQIPDAGKTGSPTPEAGEFPEAAPAPKTSEGSDAAALREP